MGQKRIDQNLGRARLDAKCGMAVPCQFHRKYLLGNLSLCWKCKLSSQLFTCTFHQLGLLTLQRCLRIRALGSPWIVSSHPHNDGWYTRPSLSESLHGPGAIWLVTLRHLQSAE